MWLWFLAGVLDPLIWQLLPTQLACLSFAPWAMLPLAIAGPASAEVRMAAVPRIARLSLVMGRSPFLVFCDSVPSARIDRCSARGSNRRDLDHFRRLTPAGIHRFFINMSALY